MPIDVDTKEYRKYIDLKAELIRRAERQESDPFVCIKGQEAAKRAITVAAAGAKIAKMTADPRWELSVLFMGHPKGGKSMLVAAAARVDVVARELQPCPCGWFSHPMHACNCTASQIKRHVAKHRAEIEGSDIYYPVGMTPSREMLSTHRGSDLPYVLDQLKHVHPDMAPRINDVTLNNLGMDEYAVKLLRLAITELALAEGAVSRVKVVAAAIAALREEKYIDGACMAEAIQYRPRI